MQPTFTLPSFAKINWTLRILGKRDDGFHELFTVFQTVSLHDTISFAASDSLELTCDNPYVPVDGRNLILKAAAILRARYGVTQGAAMHLEKRIPSPGGLGGGSSNAAVALIGLARLWELDEGIDIHSIAAELGSDVAFFLYGGTALGTGRGEEIEPIEDRDEPCMLIVTPQISVSTRDAFGEINAPTLTNEARNHILSVCRKEAGSLNPGSTVLTNDFERTVFSAHPEIENVKNTLLELGAANAALSGSGASVFAVFEKEETRQAAIKALDQASTWRKFAVSTISRSKYCEALNLR
ncbi:MAG TPA: 4-(cytidine 5'-diphospho)-2-C-methyl-D-erythritol kinase [Pyrinomonadaceae bacterium]|nr:4-(cytidine 5'-diphospho)-2-C-methyl-D-erythritol kinase [Pyrinomonadaceae bacterium]